MTMIEIGFSFRTDRGRLCIGRMIFKLFCPTFRTFLYKKVILTQFQTHQQTLQSTWTVWYRQLVTQSWGQHPLHQCAVDKCVWLMEAFMKKCSLTSFSLHSLATLPQGRAYLFTHSSYDCKLKSCFFREGVLRGGGQYWALMYLGSHLVDGWGMVECRDDLWALWF